MGSNQSLIVGRLPYLVCAPFFHTSLSGEEGIQFIDGVPSQLNADLQSGKIDCAPSSSFEYGLHFQDYQLFPGISTSSRMEMKSVLFLSHLPWEELDDQAIALSSDSATSNVLFQILCSLRFAVKPRIASESQVSNVQGQVFIGDRALEASLSGKWFYRYDLADVWMKWQGLPFSFGLWMVRRDIVKAKAERIKLFLHLLRSSVASFTADPVKALDAWTAIYPSTLPRELMLDFYETADYGFSKAHASSLDVFYRLAFEAGFLKVLPKLDFINPD
jgi:chorismate dehydratase